MIMVSVSFNPRTYIRYDVADRAAWDGGLWFQSTYLYKVRPTQDIYIMPTHSFNPRTYIRYDQEDV